MFRNSLCKTVAAIVLVCAGSHPYALRADNVTGGASLSGRPMTANPAVVTVLDAVNAKPIPPERGGEISFDFGSVDEGSIPTLDHSFALRNDSSAPISLAQLQPSCGCTTAALDGRAQLPLSVQPGQSAVIDVSLNMRQLEPGQFSKLLFVKLTGQAMPAAIIRLSGNIVAAATFVEPQIDFGTLAYGDTPSKSLAVTVDTRLIPDPDRLSVLTSNPDVKVTLKSSTPSSSNTRLLTYTATVVEKPRLGLLKCEVLLRGPSKSGETIMWGSPARIAGNVVGSFAATPESVSFDSGSPIPAWSQDVLITGINRADLPSVKVFCASPLITATLAPAEQSEAKDAATKLHIAVSDKMHPGTLQTQVLVTLPSGEQMMLPIFVHLGSAH